MAFDPSGNSSMRCIKYILLIISSMFAITALLLILVGTTIQAIFGDFHQFIDDHFSSPPALLIAIGFIMFFVSTLGALGAIRESVLLINLYGVFLFLIFILEVAAAIAAFVLQGEVREMLIRTMNETMSDYDNDTNLAAAVDYMQTGLECCGIRGPNDWHNILGGDNRTNFENTTYLPESCCKTILISDTIKHCEQNNFYPDGCLDRMDFIISQSAMLIATGATTVALVQLLGVFCAFMLAKTVRHNKSIREARRWQYQQSLGILVAGKNDINNQLPNGYTQLKESENVNFQTETDPVTYTANSPSVN